MKVGDLVYSPTTENYIGIVTATGEDLPPNRHDGETVQVLWNDRQQTLHSTCFLEVLNEAG
jgi:hypothetical protein